MLCVFVNVIGQKWAPEEKSLLAGILNVLL